MGIVKTDRDCRRERVAHDINEGLIGSGIHVTAGGRDGPYQVTVSRLFRGDMERLLEKLIGREPSGVEID